MIALLFLAFSAHAVPKVNVLRDTESDALWFIQDVRSNWSVAHICFQSEASSPSLMSMESLFFLLIVEKENEFLKHGVSLSQRVSQDEICLQIGALKEELPWAVSESMDLFEDARWKRRDWKSVQKQYREECRRQSMRLGSVHELAEHVVWSGEYWFDWDWRYWQINRDSRRFKRGAKRKVVVVGALNEEQVRALFPQVSNNIKKARNIDEKEVIELVVPDCAIVSVEGFPQEAVSQRFSFPELSSTERQYLSIILGSGTRSRLSEELREERGLVYSIGTKVRGSDIVVQYSIAPESLEEAMISVSKILSELASEPVTKLEFERAKGVLSQRYYQTQEDYQSLATIYSLYSKPMFWESVIENRLEYQYAQYPSEIQFTAEKVVVTSAKSNSLDKLAACRLVKQISLEELVELKSTRD